MRAIRFVHDIPAETAPSAEFRVFQGARQIGGVAVAAGQSASFSTTSDYSVQAFTAMGDFRLSSNTVRITRDSAELRVQVLTENGFYDLQLMEGTDTRPSVITCENTWRQPVTFKFHREDSPIEFAVEVDAHAAAEVSTEPVWQVDAIVDGDVTETLTISDPDATVTLSRGPVGIRLYAGE